MGLLGGILGCDAAYLALRAFSAAAPLIGGLPAVQMPVQVMVETMILSALIGILSALAPASSAVRRNIVDALRAVA